MSLARQLTSIIDSKMARVERDTSSMGVEEKIAFYEKFIEEESRLSKVITPALIARAQNAIRRLRGEIK